MQSPSDGTEEREFQRRVGQIEARLAEFEAGDDPATRAGVEELVGGVLELHGAGLERMLQLVAAAGENGSAVLASFADDALVRSLLLLHDLHPVDLRTRVEAALETVRPMMGSHGGGVELLGLEQGVAHLRLQGTCDGCPSSQVTLEQAVEKAIMEAAPDIERIEVEAATATAGPAHEGLVCLPMAPAGAAPVTASPARRR